MSPLKKALYLYPVRQSPGYFEIYNFTNNNNRFRPSRWICLE